MEKLKEWIKNFFKHEPLIDPTLINAKGSLPTGDIAQLAKEKYNELAKNYEGMTVNTHLLDDLRVFKEGNMRCAMNVRDRVVIEQGYNLLITRMKTCQERNEPFHTDVDYEVTIEDLQPMFERRRIIRSR